MRTLTRTFIQQTLGNIKFEVYGHTSMTNSKESRWPPIHKFRGATCYRTIVIRESVLRCVKNLFAIVTKLSKPVICAPQKCPLQASLPSRFASRECCKLFPDPDVLNSSWLFFRFHCISSRQARSLLSVPTQQQALTNEVRMPKTHDDVHGAF